MRRYENIWYDFFTLSDALDNYLANQFSGTGWFVIDVNNERLASDTSNHVFQARVKPELLKRQGPFDNIYAKCEYLGTSDDDRSAISIIDTFDRSWTFGITNDARSNGLIRYDEWDSMSEGLNISGINRSTTQAHLFEIVYLDNTFTFLINGEISLTYSDEIQIKTIGILSDAQNPPAYWNTFEAWLEI